MNVLKKHLTKHVAKFFAVLLVLAVAILPTSAGILSTLLDVIPTYSAEAYETTYEQIEKVKTVALPNGTTRDLPYTEYVYTVTLHADYFNQKLNTSTLSREAIKEILRENMPAEVYDLLVARDPAAIKTFVKNLIRETVLEYLRDDGFTPGGPLIIDPDELPDVAITAELLEDVKHWSGLLIGDDKIFTKSEVVDIVDMQGLADRFAIAAADLPLQGLCVLFYILANNNGCYNYPRGIFQI